MDTHARRTTALIGATVAATTLATSATVAPAPAAPAAPPQAPSRVTVHLSDRTPAAGQQFRVSGAVWSHGHRVPSVVRVKIRDDGIWRQLPGAVTRTNRADRYHLRIVLLQRGERHLRVVGRPLDPGIKRAVTPFTVTVH